MKKRFLASGLVIAAVIAIYVYSSESYTEKETPATPTSSAPAKEIKMTKSNPLDAQEVADKKKPPERAWGRDPFELPRYVKLNAGEEKMSDAVKPQIKKVTAILIGDSRKVVSINHKVVTVGDLIDGEKVMGINPDGVILEKDGQSHIIRLEGKSIKWIKNNGNNNEK
jgi:type II secretory pathway component PulC